MHLRCLVGVILGVSRVTVRGLGVVGRRQYVAGPLMPGSLQMVQGCMIVVVGGVLMEQRGPFLIRHPLPLFLLRPI